MDRVFIYIQRTLASKNIFLDILAGSLTGIQVIIFTVIFASLIFSGALADFQSQGISFFLIGAVIIALVIGLGSSSRIITACPHDTSAILGMLISVSIVTKMNEVYPASNPFPTVIIALSIMTSITGLSALLLGKYQLGKLVYFIPYPVMGGFLAGTGWLLFMGAFSALNYPLSLNALPGMFYIDPLLHWLPGLLYALLLCLSLRYFKHYLIYPCLLIGSFFLFYSVLFLTNTSVSEASNMGFMLGPFKKVDSNKFLDIQMMLDIHWDLIIAEIPDFIIAAVLNISGLLLRLVGFELTTKTNMNINHELSCAGVANIAAGSIGCIAGFHSLSYSTLNFNLGATGRMTSVTVAFLCMLIYFIGLPVLSYIPRFVFCILLFAMSFNYLIEWIIDSRKNLTGVDYGIVWIILVTIAYAGLFEGIVIGILISLIVFVVRYSFLKAIKSSFYGELFHSNTVRSLNDMEVLEKHGHEIHIILLQDYLFFGNCDVLLKRVKSLISKNKKTIPDYILIDFRLVRGFDASSAVTLIKISQITDQHHVQLILTQVSPFIINIIEDSFARYAIVPGYQRFKSLDQGLEWCENQLIAHYGITGKHNTLEQLIEKVFPNVQDAEVLLEYFQKDEIRAGSVIYEQGSEAGELFFIESGKVHIYGEAQEPAQKKSHFSTLLAGSVVGEIGLYLGTRRSATAVARDDCIIYRLDKTQFQKMQSEHPKLAGAFHFGIAKLLAERVMRGNRIIQHLLQ